jgi:radical SAM protein
VSDASPRWKVDFDRVPFLVIWETTLACDLACRHCRACAIPGPIDDELSTEEGKALIDQEASMGTPLLVLSGGDPATRGDLLELVAHAKSRGLRVATVPAATPRLTRDLIGRLKEAGLDQVAFSLDFPEGRLHDAFRGSPRAFRRTVDAVGWAREVGLPPQINSCVWAESVQHLGRMAEMVERLGVVFWEVFFLVPTGRGKLLRGLTPDECEGAFEILRRAQDRKKFILKVTEAPHYRRFLLERHSREEGRAEHSPSGSGGLGLAHRGVNAGNGFLFVSHVGEIFPSGFLPVSAGNVRRHALAGVYRESPLFRALRDPARLHGRCSRCPFRAICGGSRSRAYAVSGDWLAEEPWCDYPAGQIPREAGTFPATAAAGP